MHSSYWQGKIQALLHHPSLKALSKTSTPPHLAGQIAAASDRMIIGDLPGEVPYGDKGLPLRHLLSGDDDLHFTLKPNCHQQQLTAPEVLNNQIQDLIPAIPSESSDASLSELKQQFWWLWRCYPQATCQALESDPSVLLLPADARMPDASIWSHNSITAAIAGAIASAPETDIPSKPHLATFSFTPVQDLIKASRKMRDFWSGSWVLHYLSAKICWSLAQTYGPDTLLYPSLFQQPMIDYWLLKEWPHFCEWINSPTSRQLMTAGFPNVIVIVLPEHQVAAAMQQAEQSLKYEWLELSKLVFELLENRHWSRSLKSHHKTWTDWLTCQWQTYWSAAPIGDRNNPLTPDEDWDLWRQEQNQCYGLTAKEGLFSDAEQAFIQAVQKQSEQKLSINVGSWWPHIFEHMRQGLMATKSARVWTLPTAFSVRSSISGFGAAVCPERDDDPKKKDWVEEIKVQDFWKRQSGLFDGKEMLNATEIVKRSLHKILPKLFEEYQETELQFAYPDLTAGVAGYLKVSDDKIHDEHYHQTCAQVSQHLPPPPQNSPQLRTDWGIPWVDHEEAQADLRRHHPRLLNAGWAAEEVETEPNSIDGETPQRSQVRRELQGILKQAYPDNNPADWYALAVGDGDGMRHWLQGKPLQDYRKYIPESFKLDASLQALFEQFKAQTKRMGPSTHNALSRALLDFSNQLVPYLTEIRYAGRLIYSGGDDVLAYTNLWEWDNWLWDLRRCFKGQPDPHDQFDHQGNYWRWQHTDPCPVSDRPLFTMGSDATISFGLILCHHSVPMAIALENLWEAEEEAKKNRYGSAPEAQKDSVQVRILYGNGNILSATSQFDTFHQWQSLLTLAQSFSSPHKKPDIAALLEQMAALWNQHPVPEIGALKVWLQAFCDRRDIFQNQPNAKVTFLRETRDWLTQLWTQVSDKDRESVIRNWLKVAAFVVRKREIKLGGQP